MRRLAALPLLALAGCDLSMTRQARHEPQGAVTLWPGGPAQAPAPEGTLALDAPVDPVETPPPLTRALLDRGAERYAIYCAICHGPRGDGDGTVVRRGFPHPPSYHEARLVAAPPAAIVDIIAHGKGAMYGYGDRVAPADRWAIAAYVKALQAVPERPR